MIDSRGIPALYRDNSVEVDSGTVVRSPLIRTLAPVVKFFRSRAGAHMRLTERLLLSYVAAGHLPPRV